MQESRRVASARSSKRVHTSIVFSYNDLTIFLSSEVFFSLIVDCFKQAVECGAQRSPKNNIIFNADMNKVLEVAPTESINPFFMY